jgi:hypothetical protein
VGTLPPDTTLPLPSPVINAEPDLSM